MIAKDTTTIVRFYVTTTDGFPATGKASSISANISIDGDTATAITATISESDSTNLPGWYEFEYTFSTAGNAFITFSCSGCIIMPWEEQVVEVSTSPAPSASDIATAVWGANFRSLSTLSVTSGGISFDIATSNGVNQAIRVIKDYGDTKWLTASGFATPSDIPTSDISAIKTKTDNLPASPAAVGSAMTLTSAYDAAKTAAQAGDAMTLTAAYNAAKTASQFNAATDTVTINATQAATLAAASDLDSVATKVELIKSKTDNLPANPAAQGAQMSLTNEAITSVKDGLATANNVTTAKADIIAAMPDISGLSTFDAATDTVTIDATQAATMVTADVSGLATPADIPTADITAIKTKVDSLHNTDLTGIATSANVTAAQTAIIEHGDSNWTGEGSGGGATPQQIWEYPTRTITASPTDISSLATKTDLSSTQTAIVNAMPSVSGLATSQNVTDAKEAIIAEIPAVPNDYAKVSDLSGLSTFNAATDKVTLNATEDATLGAIKTKIDTLNNADLTGIATVSDVSGAQSAIIAAMPTIPDDYAKASDITAINALLTRIDSGVLHWSTTETTLTLYNDNGETVKTYSLTRDEHGNITRINPNA